MTFQLTQYTAVKMTNLNTRIEKHGPESVPAVDLTFTMDAQNKILDDFHCDLLDSIYTTRETSFDLQESIEGVEEIAYLPNLRFTAMDPIKWNWNGSGYEFSVDYGLGGDRALVLECVEVGKIVIDPKEGGTVELKFRVQCNAGLTEAIIGKLAMMNGQEVKIMLHAPTTVEQTGAKFDPLFPDYKPDAPLTATDVFLGTAGDEQAEAVH